jgi:hypothetical protein
MNRLLTFWIALLLLFSFKAKSDIIIINGTTFNLNNESPLDQYSFVQILKSTLVSYNTTSYDDPCKDYNAEWRIINGQLYLANIYSCNTSKTMLKANLKSLFNNDVVDDKVKANWFTGNLWVATGKHIHTLDMMVPIYDAETRITIVNGVVTETKVFSYPHPQELIYLNTHTSDVMAKFIYSHIDWNKLPALNKQKKKVIVIFETGPSGKPENIKLIRESPNDAAFNNETKRVISTVPMGTYYRNGVLFKQTYTMPVNFTEELRQKYSH